jgi:hypothetical protein
VPENTITPQGNYPVRYQGVPMTWDQYRAIRQATLPAPSAADRLAGYMTDLHAQFNRPETMATCGDCRHEAWMAYRYGYHPSYHPPTS